MNNEIYLGYITMTHGIKGELKFYSEIPEFKELEHLNLPIMIEKENVSITSIRPHKNHYLIRINDLNDINLVEKYRNKKVFMLREKIDLKEKDYFITDLIGFSIMENEIELGKVSEIRYNNGGILLEISKKFYIPFHDNFIEKVDTKNSKIIVKNVRGLML